MSRDAKLEATVKEEYAIQAAGLPESEMPTCMNLFDRWAMCFGECSNFSERIHLT